MGFDPYFNYHKASYATAILTSNPKSIFVVTNKDCSYPTARYILPGTGTDCFNCCLMTVTLTSADNLFHTPIPATKQKTINKNYHTGK